MVTQGTRDQDKQAVDNEVNADIKAMNEDKDRVQEEEIRLKGKLQGKETDEATKAQERLATAIASIKDSKNTEESVMRTFLYGLSFARDETKKMVETLASAHAWPRWLIMAANARRKRRRSCKPNPQRRGR